MKFNKILSTLVGLLIIIVGIFGISASFNQNFILAGICLLIDIGIGLVYAFCILVDYIDMYHTETRLLRADLAKLNKEIITAFENIDTNFETLVHAIDDFVVDLEGESKE